MSINEKTSRLLGKRDIVNIGILLAIAIAIGIYLIATTVVIAEDGVYYIKTAQRFSSNAVDVIKKDHPFGYPFLVFIAHKLVSACNNSLSLSTWIYSAQSVSLLCRLLAIVFLYFIGKLLTGSNNSFWAILIFVILPYPAKAGSDVLRDWPHLLFLAAGFLFLLWGAKQGKWWMFGAAGLVAGLGYMIRDECAQLVIYGILWLLISFFFPANRMSRTKLVLALLVLLTGFAISTIPYMKLRGSFLPLKLKNLLALSCQLDACRLQERKIDDTMYSASGLPVRITQAVRHILQGVSENLMYFFLPAWVIGIWWHWGGRNSHLTAIEKFFIPAFTAFNFVMLTLLFYNYGYVSRRHVLPLVAFTISYVPIGLQVMSNWIAAKFSRQNPQLWFFVLLGTGICISLLNLFKPIHAEKQIYRTVAKWLAQNTGSEDAIAVADERISFYAERKGLEYSGGKIPKGARYLLKVVSSEEQQPDLGQAVQEEQSWWIDKQNGKKLVAYRVMQPKK